jgi:hypothetical protein
MVITRGFAKDQHLWFSRSFGTGAGKQQEHAQENNIPGGKKLIVSFKAFLWNRQSESLNV